MNQCAVEAGTNGRPAECRHTSAWPAPESCALFTVCYTRSPARSRALVGTRGVRDVYACINKYALLLSMIQSSVDTQSLRYPYGLTHGPDPRAPRHCSPCTIILYINCGSHKKSRMNRPRGRGRQRRASAAMGLHSRASLPSRVHTVACSHEGRRWRVRRLSLRRS